MKTRRAGISTAVAAAAVVAVVVVAGGAYLLLYSGGGAYTSSTSSQPTTTCCTSSTVSSSYRLSMQLEPSTPLVSSDVVANYTIQLSVIGSVSSALSVAAALPAGVTAQVYPNQIPVGSESNKISISFTVDGSAAVGTYPFNVTVSSPGQTYSQKFSLEVVKYLVVMVGTGYFPDSLSVPVGSTVYWMRLNGAIDQYDNGDHNVVFNAISASSPTLSQYQSWSYEFTQAGSFSYYCTFHPYMKGTVSAG